MSFEIALEEFSGPLQLLLELIEKEKLPITDISLARVTEAFLKHIEKQTPPAEELADFLVIAAKLLLIKSETILPRGPEEESPADDLAEQLRMYQAFVKASEFVDQLARRGYEMYSRERELVQIEPRFAPPASVSVSALHDSFLSLLKRLEPFFQLQHSALERVASVKDRIQEIQAALTSRAQMTFRDLTLGATSKAEIVVSFLALLELVKQRLVNVGQKGMFSDISIHQIDSQI